MDGLTYTILVYRETGGLFAVWECRQCGDRSAPSTLTHDCEQAIADCEHFIIQHHAQSHKPVLNI
jgi:hypothetical protein